MRREFIVLTFLLAFLVDTLSGKRFHDGSNASSRPRRMPFCPYCAHCLGARYEKPKKASAQKAVMYSPAELKAIQMAVVLKVTYS